MTFRQLASHIADNLPDDANGAVLLTACGYIASILLAEVPANIRGECVDKFVETLRTAVTNAH
jgi:hypothetical protein